MIMTSGIHLNTVMREGEEVARPDSKACRREWLGEKENQLVRLLFQGIWQENEERGWGGGWD